MNNSSKWFMISVLFLSSASLLQSMNWDNKQVISSFENPENPAAFEAYRTELFTRFRHMFSDKNCINLKPLEDFYVNVVKKMVQAGIIPLQYSSSSKNNVRQKVVARKCELCLGAAACIAIGGLLGWTARSWLIKK